MPRADTRITRTYCGVMARSEANTDLRALEKLPGVKYLRFMDGWIILAESRWKLRKAVRIMNRVLAELELEQHPEQKETLSPVSRTRLQEKLQKHFTHAARLYEQGRLKSLATIERYLSHWLRWTKGSGIALSTALETIRRSLSQICQERADVMIPTFIQAMKAWVNSQETNEKNIPITSSSSSKKGYSGTSTVRSHSISDVCHHRPLCGGRI